MPSLSRADLLEIDAAFTYRRDVLPNGVELPCLLGATQRRHLLRRVYTQLVPLVPDPKARLCEHGALIRFILATEDPLT